MKDCLVNNVTLSLLQEKDKNGQLEYKLKR